MALCAPAASLIADLQRRVIDLVVINAHRNQADPFGFLARQRLAQQQVSILPWPSAQQGQIMAA